MKPSWLASVRSWLPGVREVSAGCSRGVGTPVKRVAAPWREAPPTEHAEALIADLQASGHTGVQPRGEILTRYHETCVGWELVPIGFNALCEALADVCERKRPFVNGHRITAYVIPKPPRGRHLSIIPSGNIDDDIPFDLPKKSRAGTSHAQA
jgi:hypothetical protein